MNAIVAFGVESGAPFARYSAVAVFTVVFCKHTELLALFVVPQKRIFHMLVIVCKTQNGSIGKSFKRSVRFICHGDAELKRHAVSTAGLIDHIRLSVR